MTIDLKDYQNSAQSIRYKDLDGIPRVNSFRHDSKQKQEPHDHDKYWKEKVQLLIDDKKRWMKEMKDTRQKLNQFSDRIKALEAKNKHLNNVIGRFGVFSD